MAQKPQTPNVEGRRQWDGDGNRAYDIRRDDDKFQTPKISIYDVDYAILWWISNHIKPQVVENERMIDVPVIFANGETWSQIKQHGYMRDNTGKAQAPVITIRRTGMVENDSMPKMDANNLPSNLRFKLFPHIQTNNTYTRPTYNTKKSQTYYMLALPEYYKVSYEILIWADLQEQLNEIVHELIVTNRFAWGDALKFTTYLRDTSFDTIKSSGEDRLVKATFQVEVDAILVKDFEARVSTLQKAYSIKRVRFENEREQPDFITYDDNRLNTGNSHIDQQPYNEMLRDNQRNVRYPQTKSD